MERYEALPQCASDTPPSDSWEDSSLQAESIEMRIEAENRVSSAEPTSEVLFLCSRALLQIAVPGGTSSKGDVTK